MSRGSPGPSTTPPLRARRHPIPSATRTAAARRGLSLPWPRSWRTPVTPAARYGTASAPITISSTPRTLGWVTARCSDGTCLTDGSSPPGPPTPHSSARATTSPRSRSPPHEAPPGQPPAGTSSPGCSAADSADGAWNQPGPTATPPTGAATAAQARPSPPRIAQERLPPRRPDPAPPRGHGHPARQRVNRDQPRERRRRSHHSRTCRRSDRPPAV